MGFEDVVTVSTCNLNQWALDFDGNLLRICESIRQAKAQGARYRVGPELEVTGYGCEDHFLEQDTFVHADESLARLLTEEHDANGEPLTANIVCDVGMPILHRGVRYNCRVFCLNGKILLIRPKLFMADDGNYRETRWFTAWGAGGSDTTLTESHILSPALQTATGQRSVPFGAALLQFNDTVLAAETCEELFTPASPHIALGLAGAELISNGSGSHHQLRKLDRRLDLIRGATAKSGGVYLYANQQGCDGGRLYYDGCALIAVNGDVVCLGSQFSARDVEVLVANIDLGDVRSFRGACSSRSEQAAVACGSRTSGAASTNSAAAGSAPGAVAPSPSVVNVDFSFATWTAASGAAPPMPTRPLRSLKLHTPAEEIGRGPACWLWDYLRRSGGSGFFLPLSGGADSSSVATIVSVMCHIVVNTLAEERRQALADLDEDDGDGDWNTGLAGPVEHDVRRVLGIGANDALPGPPAGAAAPTLDAALFPTGFNAASLANAVLHTTYMGTVNSSFATRDRARRLAEQIGSHHLNFDIDAMVKSLSETFARVTGKTPRFSSQGGTVAEDLALQNIQARLRMVSAYLLAQLLPWTRGRRGFLLVLGSANVDEALRGYMTKYDCSSADLNPIGSVSKGDLKLLMRWAAREYKLVALNDIVAAPPTAELRPMETNDSGDGETEHSQLDEEDMGMTYEELGTFGRLRKLSRCGPLAMFQKLCHEASATATGAWAGLSPMTVAEKVKRFFRFYSINRHKLTTLTPAYHAEEYSPDDNRFDLRQFLYNVRWPRQFGAIDALAAKLMGTTDGSLANASDSPSDSRKGKGDGKGKGKRKRDGGGAHGTRSVSSTSKRART